ncbi:MAG: YneF family protein [Alicyclobacillaceae bacterium]|nr:YneF family protein [Alicyclobacillaceae bacterium]
MIYLGFIGFFLLGGLVGFAGGVWYLRRQLQNMQMDEKQVMAMAKSMGLSLNQKQLQTVMRHMKQRAEKSGFAKSLGGNKGKHKPGGKRKIK